MTPPRRRLLIVWHSLTGTARQMAEATQRGALAAEPGVEAMLMHAGAAGPDAVLGADGYVFATPETLATMAGLMKDFFDRCYYPALGRIEGRPYAALIAAGNDGTGALRQVERIAAGWRLRAVAEPILLRTGAETPEAILAPKRADPAALGRCEELGAALVAGLAMGIF